MNKYSSIALGLVVALSSFSSVQGATIARIFALSFDSFTGADFLGIGPLPPSKTLSLLAVINDGGNFTDLRLFNGNLGLGAFPQLGAFDAANSFWSIGNGPTDTFSMTGISTSSPGRFLTFTIASLPSSVANSNSVVANADAILRQPAVLGSAFTFGGATGYAGTIQAVPEPGTMVLLVGAVAGVGFYRRRKGKVA